MNYIEKIIYSKANNNLKNIVFFLCNFEKYINIILLILFKYN